jgi:hypothetical protein
MRIGTSQRMKSTDVNIGAVLYLAKILANIMSSPACEKAGVK